MKKARNILFALVFLLPALMHAQGHGIPLSFTYLFFASDTSTVHGGSARIRMNTFYGFAAGTMGDVEKPETSQKFTNYNRLGFSFTIDRQLIKNIFVGFTIPYLQSNIERLPGLYPGGNYTWQGVSEVRLRLGFEYKSKSKLWTILLHSGIPVDKGREGFFRPEVYIGHDGTWNIGLDYSLTWFLSNKFRFQLSSEAMMRIPKSGMIISGEPALIWTGNQVNAIQATINLRDYVTACAGIVYLQQPWTYTLAWESYYETADNAYGYSPAGLTQMEAFVQHELEHDALVHSVNVGLTRDFQKLHFGLYGRIPVDGYTAFRENMIMFVFGFNF
ncbi:MAG: hypothetical protein Q7J34_04840 [Bacteroidales bacterium]|nr:hypothetical protein [Bacteroidales bacterium]